MASKGNKGKAKFEKPLKGRVTGNVKRHFEPARGVNNAKSENKGQDFKNNNNKIVITMNKNQFLSCCVGMVTVRNMPFRIFDDEDYFKKLLHPYEEYFKTKVNSKSITDKMNDISLKIKESIAISVFQNMISLKIDITTRMRKSILCINIQYIKDSRIITNTIGIVQLKKKYTAQYLKDEIINCLKEYNIDISQLYSFTSDNGSNMIRTSKLLQDVQEEMQSSSRGDFCDEKAFLNINVLLCSAFDVVICAAHAIQLAAEDVFKTIELNVNRCRKDVKDLRSRIRKENPLNLQLPPLDNISKWNSTFRMIEALHDLKDSLNENKNLSTREFDWLFIRKFLASFKPLSNCTMKIQSEQYVIGDFYRDWLYCEVELEEIEEENRYASRLLKVMKLRRENLRSNDAFNAAIYLDPRFNFINTPFLTEQQKKIAVVSRCYAGLKLNSNQPEGNAAKNGTRNKADFHHYVQTIPTVMLKRAAKPYKPFLIEQHLLKTNEAIKNLAVKSQLDDNASANKKPSANEVPSGSYSKLENKISSLLQLTPATDRTTKQKLDNLCYEERMPFETNILEFWKNIKHRDPELTKLVNVALAVPSTQMSVEMSSSAFSLIMNNLRSKMAKDAISNLLIVNLNENILKNLDLSKS